MADPNVRRTALLLIAGAVLLAALAATSAHLSFRQQSTFETLVRDRELRRSASAVMTALREVEIGQQGYMLTGNPDFLRLYDEAVDALPRLEADPRGRRNRE